MERPWEALFLEAVGQTCNVTTACKLAGIGRRTAYNHREADQAFASKWHEAIEEGCDDLESEARRRAMDGVEKPIFWRGQRVATVREYSDTLLIFMLKAYRPEKFREVKPGTLEALLAKLPADFARELRKALGEQFAKG
jgi:hypothetical protein